MNPSYQGLSGANAGNNSQHQRSINQSATAAAAGAGMLDNGQYYQGNNKWNWRGSN